MRRRDPAYAFGVSGIQKAPWRPDQDEAMLDAVEAGFGTIEEYAGTVFLDALAEIWMTNELVPTLKRNVVPIRKNGPTSDAQLSRIERIIARREAQERASSG